MRKIIKDPNQLNIEFPEESAGQKRDDIIKDNNSEPFDVAQEKELDLIESQKAQEEALNNIRVSFPARTQEEKDDDLSYVLAHNKKVVSKKDAEWAEKEKGRIFDNTLMLIIGGVINDFREKVISDIASNGKFSDKNDALDFDKIKKKAEECTLLGYRDRASRLNQGMGVLRRISNIKTMLKDLKHQKFIDYMDNLKTDKGVTCGFIVNSKEYDEIMDIIKQYRRK